MDEREKAQYCGDKFCDMIINLKVEEQTQRHLVNALHLSIYESLHISYDDYLEDVAKMAAMYKDRVERKNGNK